MYAARLLAGGRPEGDLTSVNTAGIQKKRFCGAHARGDVLTPRRCSGGTALCGCSSILSSRNTIVAGPVHSRAACTRSHGPLSSHPDPRYRTLRVLSVTLPAARRDALIARCSLASRQRRHRPRRCLHPRRWLPAARRRAWRDALRALRGPQTTRRAHWARGERAPFERLQRQVRRAAQARVPNTAQARELPRGCVGARWESLPRGT